MADWAKIAIKTGLIVIFTAAIIALFVAVPFPVVTLSSDIGNGIAFAKSYLTYWMPNFQLMFSFALAVIGFEFGVLLFKFASQAAKWLMKVNE